MLPQNVVALLCGLACTLSIRAQALFPLSVAQLSSTGSAATEGLDAWFDNPAAPAGISAPAFRLFGSSRFTGLDWGAASLVAALPAGRHAFSLAAYRRGASYFHESALLLGWARPMSERVLLGVRAGALVQRADSYEPQYQLEAGMGMQVRVAPQWRLGASVLHLPGFFLGQHPAPAFHFGLSGRPYTQLLLNFSLNQSAVFGLDWRAGLVWKLRASLELSLGIRHAGLTQPAFGLGWQLDQAWQAVLATQWHPQLGWTSGLELKFAARQ